MEDDNFKYFECELKLDSETASYGPGDVISGHLEINNALALEFKEINVTYRGDAFVYGAKKEIQHDIYEGTLTDFQHVAHEQYLMVKQNVRGVTTLQPETHCILLLCAIPITAPSTYNSKYGCVRYSILVNVEFEDSTKNQSILKIFKVIAPLDLNSIENVRHPILIKFTKETAFMQPVPRVLSIDVRVPSSGFSFGQSIPLDLSVSNKTHIRVKWITIALVRRQQYHSDAFGIINSNESEVASVKSLPVERYSNRRCTTHLNIPQIVSTMTPNLQYCSIIDVEYFLKVTAKLKFFTTQKMTSQAKIHIGTIPLSDGHQSTTSDEALSLSDFPENYLNRNVDAMYPYLPQNITNDGYQSYFRGAALNHVAVTPSAPPME